MKPDLEDLEALDIGLAGCSRDSLIITYHISLPKAR